MQLAWEIRSPSEPGKTSSPMIFLLCRKMDLYCTVIAFTQLLFSKIIAQERMMSRHYSALIYF